MKYYHCNRCDRYWYNMNDSKCEACGYQEEERKKMKVTLSNGMVIEGTSDQIADVARKLGVSLGDDGVFYMSSSLGLVKISDMGEQHLRNAILKRERARLDNLKALDLKSFLRELASGTRDITTLAMVRELGGRYRS